MKAEQVSFSAGEVSPLLHARVDLARYRIGLAELVNMIVLPQGGITRRAGMTLRSATSGGARLIPFEYNTTDSVMLEFSDKSMRVWSKTSGGYIPLVRIGSPYSLSDVKDLRYVQSGNVMFLVHRKYKPMMLVRSTATSWKIEELAYQGGPWIDGEEWAGGVKLKIEGAGRTRTIRSQNGNVFSAGLVGTLLKLEYTVDPKMIEINSQLSPNKEISPAFEVKGTMNVMTTGDWQGVITVERSVDGGSTWIAVRQYVRKDTESQGQWDFTITEAEEGVLYRVTAQHMTVEKTDNSMSITYGASQVNSMSNYVKVNTSSVEEEGWVYNSDKTQRTSIDGSVTQWRVLSSDANGDYTTVWQTLPTSLTERASS